LAQGQLNSAQQEIGAVHGELGAARQEMSMLQEQLQAALNRIAAIESRALQPVVQVASPARSNRPQPLKVDVARYKGMDSESLPRWLVELDAAITARCIEGDTLKVTFAMSCLAGRAKTWAFGMRMANPNCFLTYLDFKDEIVKAFEPPKSELRIRGEFLRMTQGKRDIPTYAQYARYMVSCVTVDPIDDTTQVVVFIRGLVDGPIKTQLFREVPGTLEEAISMAMQEDFGLQQAYAHSASYHPRARQGFESDGTEPMDLSMMATSRPPSGRKRVECNRCHKMGHLAYECLAPQPVSRMGQRKGPPQRKKGKGRGGPRPPRPNGKSQ
jgi:hypothetical protein